MSQGQTLHVRMTECKLNQLCLNQVKLVVLILLIQKQAVIQIPGEKLDFKINCFILGVFEQAQRFANVSVFG